MQRCPYPRQGSRFAFHMGMWFVIVMHAMHAEHLLTPARPVYLCVIYQLVMDMLFIWELSYCDAVHWGHSDGKNLFMLICD